MDCSLSERLVGRVRLPGLSDDRATPVPCPGILLSISMHTASNLPEAVHPRTHRAYYYRSGRKLGKGHNARWTHCSVLGYRCSTLRPIGETVPYEWDLKATRSHGSVSLERRSMISGLSLKIVDGILTAN
jgi:hypothetical protein